MKEVHIVAMIELEPSSRESNCTVPGQPIPRLPVEQPLREKIQHTALRPTL